MSRTARSKIRLNRECLFATWGYVSTNFKTTLQTRTWQVVKKVVISLNSLKIKDQRVCFHKKFDNISDYQILSFETLLYFQWRQQCFVCFRKVFMCLWVNIFLKIYFYDRTTITSSTFIGMLQCSWRFETDFSKFVRWCNSNSFPAIARGSLSEIVDDVVRCWLLPEVLFSMRSTTVSGSVVFLSLCC